MLKRLEKGVDWRRKIQNTELASVVPADARGLGAIEGNEGNLFSDRMKDRGMSWSINMGKAIELAFNGELGKWCGGRPSDSGKGRSNQSFDLFLCHNRTAIPALGSPHASRPWGKAIRHMTMNTHRLL